MTSFQYGLIAYFAAGALATVVLVGQPRKPITPGTAAFVVLVNAVLCLAVARL